ncbi:MAG: nucleotide sugar dehydrogenase [Rhodothermia bacterium]
MTPEETVSAVSVDPAATVRDTMRTIDNAAAKKAPVGIALVVEAELLAGIVTDGDIRQAIVEGVSLEAPVSDIMISDPITVMSGGSPSEMLREMNEKVRRSARIKDARVRYLVVVDERGRVVDIHETADLELKADVTNLTVGVFGLGFVGLTLGVTLSDSGFAVNGVEVHAERAERIAGGNPPFHELGLVPLLKYQLSNGKFRVHTSPPAGLDIYIVAVGTPVSDDGVPQLDSIVEVSESIASQLKEGDLVILRSTVPVGTTRDVVLPILERASGLTCGEDFFLAFAPERTIEGQALRELRTLPQVVGGFDRRSVDLASQVFGKLSPSVIRVDSLEAAEMAKLINNAFRDLSFAFANEFAVVCDRWNLDAVKIIEAANSGYPRNPIPVPSPGVGGFCLTKDPLIYAWAGKSRNYQPLLPLHGREVNIQMIDLVADKVRRFFSSRKLDTNGKKLFVVGFAFKGQPDTSDMRHSTTLELLPHLSEAGFDLFGYDPVVDPEEISALGIKFVSVEEGFREASAVLVMNNHRSYPDLDLFTLVSSMKSPGLFFDGWHLFQRREVEQINGIEYEGLSGAL